MENPAPIANEIAGKVGRFLRGQLIISAILVVFHVVGFQLIDLPFWWLSGTIVGALTLIPYLGFVVGAALAVLITMLAGGGLELILWLLGVMLLGQLLEGLYLTPKILGRELDLHPALVFVVVIVGALFFGPLGAFFAAPVAAAAILIWRRRQAHNHGHSGPGSTTP